MSLYLIKAVVCGRFEQAWIKCRSDVDAWEQANARFGIGNVREVKWIRREGY